MSGIKMSFLKVMVCLCVRAHEVRFPGIRVTGDCELPNMGAPKMLFLCYIRLNMT